MLRKAWSIQICPSTQVALWDFIVARRATLDMRCRLVFCCVAAWSVNLSPKPFRSQVKIGFFFAQRKAFSAFPPASFKVRMPPSSAAAASMLIPFAADWLSLTSYVSSSLVFLKVVLHYWLAKQTNLSTIYDNFCIFWVGELFFFFCFTPLKQAELKWLF